MNRLKNFSSILLLSLLAATLALPGCHGGALQPHELTHIVSGRTTKAELIRQLGEPDEANDLGDGREELLFLHEDTSSRKSWFRPHRSAFWVILKNDVVSAYGERDLVKDQNAHRLWPF